MPTMLQPAPIPSLRTSRRRRRTKLVAGVAGLALLVPVGFGIADAMDRWMPMPGTVQTIDRSPAALLLAMRDVADYHAASGSYQVLKDPKLLFGSQNVVMTVSADKLERVGRDRFLQVVDAVNRRLTQGVIVQMNAEVTAGQDEGDVAARFLRQAGLLRSIGTDDG